MSEEEQIKDIVEILELSKNEIENNEDITATLDLQDLKSLKNLYDLYSKEKEKNENLKKEIFELNKEMSDFADQWLHKCKIREKIKKLENEFNFYAGRDPYEWDDSEFDGERCDTLGQQIKVLKELLEENE